VIAEMQASHLTLAVHTKMLTYSLVEVESSISTLVMHQSGPSTAEPPLETDVDSETEPPRKSLRLPHDPEAAVAHVAGDDSDGAMKGVTAR
ncbi:unnamed protein product, partial [Prorocentrum cordatum]